MILLEHMMMQYEHTYQIPLGRTINYSFQYENYHLNSKRGWSRTKNKYPKEKL